METLNQNADAVEDVEVICNRILNEEEDVAEELEVVEVVDVVQEVTTYHAVEEEMQHEVEEEMHQEAEVEMHHEVEEEMHHEVEDATPEETTTVRKRSATTVAVRDTLQRNARNPSRSRTKTRCHVPKRGLMQKQQRYHGATIRVNYHGKQVNYNW